MPETSITEPIQLKREMGMMDIVLFNIAAVLGPRWIAAAAHNGPSSISLWVIAAIGFFLPTALIIVELSTRFPNEGGIYVWTKQAFGDFHGFVCGWCYWTYTMFYFPGLLLASVSMSTYIGGTRWEYLNQSKPYLITFSLVLLCVALGMNIVGLKIGKWLQNAGGIGTYVPLVILVVIGFIVWMRQGSATEITLANSMPVWNWDTVNFWSNIAFAFVGMELVCTMSEEVKDPKKNFPRAIYISGALIVIIYILGTLAVMFMMSPAKVDPRSGVFQATTYGSVLFGLGFIGVISALLVTVGNAGGVGSTVAGVARVPMMVGIDRYLPEFFGRIHPKWGTPWISMLIQAAISAVLLLLSQINSESVITAYQMLVDAAVILYFLPFLYMYAAAIKLAYLDGREKDEHAVLVPGGKLGIWLAGGIAFVVTLLSIIVAVIPPDDAKNKSLFFIKLVSGCLLTIVIGLVLYWRGARAKTLAMEIGINSP